MSDLEKARFILNLLAKQKLEFEGAREAFSFTEAYKWLLTIAKKLENPEKEETNGAGN